MKYKKIIMLTIVIACLITVSAVNAADDVVNVEKITLDDVMDTNNEFVSVENYDYLSDVSESDEDEIISSNESIKTLNGGTFEDIQKVIDESDDGDVIELHGNYQSNGNRIHINKNLTLNGVGGTVLDGKNISGFLYCDSQKYLILNGITFIDSIKDYWGHIDVSFGQIVNCNFINNYGLISTSCDLINCSFKNCIIVSGVGDVINCSFLDSSKGGSVSNAKNIINCSFVNTTGIHDVESVVNCSFINNSGFSEGALSRAGDIINCKFINNSAEHSGSGAISHVGSVINCLFENNLVNDAYLGSAGAIYNSKDIINCTFINNYINGSGSVVFDFDDIINCNFINNSAVDPSFYKEYESRNSSIKNSKFVNTKITCYFTEINNCTFENSRLENINLNNSKITNCNLTNQVIFMIYGNISLINCNFTGNGNVKSGLQLVKNAYISGCNFFNVARIQIYCPYPYLVNCKFIKSGVAVGIWEINNCFSQVINCSFEDSEKYNALELLDGNASVLNCNFSNNEYYSIKIGSQAKNHYTTIKNCNFTNNKGTGDAIFGSCISVDRCNFINNSYGAICCDDGIITNCNFIGNLGSSAVVCSESSVVKCTFVNNKNSNYGAAMDVNYKSIVTDCIFIGNSARNGGAIRVSRSIIDNCTFKDNTATGHGAAIEVSVPGGSVEISNCIFSNNHAKITSNTIGYPIVNYANSAIVKSVGKIGLKISNCKGLFNNDDKYKVKTKIVASSVTSNEGVYLKISLKNTDFNYPISGLKIKIRLNGKTYTGITDDKGQIKQLINMPKNTYTAKITFAGNNFYLKSSKEVKITVKKATPKLTAKAKTFKSSVKIKKYTVALKTNQNKVMKNTKVTLKINGKTYSTKTNTKGQATFKITKLTKKGTFTATVKYAGNKYYYAKTLKPKITVK